MPAASRPILFLGFLFVVCVVGTTLCAQEKQNHAAATEAPKGDWNYELQGEFVGPISVGENKYESLALQIRPVGGDNFEALQYAGGLPGQKGHKPGATKLVGHRSGDFVVLSGGPWAIFAEQDHCLIVDREGNRVGQLQRVKRTSPTMGVQPPKGAIVLFDGKNTNQFTKAQMTKDRLLMAGADVKPMFQDFNMHVEFRLAFMPTADGQARSNSGCYLQSRYEVQVLDSFAQEPVFNGCSSLYRFKKPDVNMCLPPLEWQTYDIVFTAPRWSADGKKVRNARITVWQNGVKTQNNVELPNKTGAGKPEEPLLLPTLFQDHRDPVRFRNIWLVDRGLDPSNNFPAYPKPGKAKPKPPAPKPKAAKKEELPEPKKPQAKADTKVETTKDAGKPEAATPKK